MACARLLRPRGLRWPAYVQLLLVKCLVQVGIRERQLDERGALAKPSLIFNNEVFDEVHVRLQLRAVDAACKAPAGRICSSASCGCGRRSSITSCEQNLESGAERCEPVYKR